MKKFYTFLAVLAIALCGITVNAQTVTFDITAITDTMRMGTSYDGTRGDQTDGAVILSQDGVEITSSKAGANNPARLWWYYNKNNGTGVCELRFYKGGELYITAPSGKALTKIKFTARNLNASANPATLTGKEWSGNATSVTFSGTGTSQITVIEVTLQDADNNTQTDVVNVQIPVISPNGGTKTGQVTVTIKGDSTTTIYYTTDGNDPTNQSTLYEEPFTLTTVGSVTVKAVAYDVAGNASGIASQTYNIKADSTSTDPGTVTDTTATTGVQTLPFKETFSNGKGSFVIEDIMMDDSLTYVWSEDKTRGFMKASAFKNQVNYDAVSQIVSPVISLEGAKDPVLTFDHTARFFTSISDEINVLICMAEPTGFTEWIPLTINTLPDGNSWAFVSDTISLAEYKEKNIQLAFRYASTANGACTWEVKNVSVIDRDTTSDPDPVNPDDDDPEVGEVTLPYEEPMSAGIGQFVIHNITRPEAIENVWVFDSQYGMKATAFANSTNYAAESEILSPIIDLGTAELPVLAYQHAGKFFGTIENEVGVWVRTADGGEYSEWVQMPIGKYPTSWTFVKDTISLEDFVGSKIQISFRYISTETKAGTWEVKGISVFDASEGGGGEDPDDTLLYSEDCTSSENTLNINNIDVDESIYVWSFGTQYGAKATAYVNKTNYATQSRLETPAIDIPEGQPTRLVFSQCISKHFGNVEEEATLWIKTVDGTSAAPSLKEDKWDQVSITYPEIADGKSFSAFEKQTVDLSVYGGKKIVIGFLYTSTTSAAGTWEIKDIAVKSDGIPTDIEKVQTETTVGKNVIFDLQGRRVANPTKGIYIVNGKKVILK